MAVQLQFIKVSNTSIESASSWIYLGDWILVLILGIAFVFYFDRLLGFILSLIAKILWKTMNISINIESFRLSILGGRLMIKNLTIMTEDWTISVLHLNFTWRYWLLGATRIPEYLINTGNDISETPEVTKADNEKLPSRFLLALDGLEIFMYNRTFAYDNIVELLNKTKEQTVDEEGSSTNSNLRYRSRDEKERVSTSTSTSASDNNNYVVKSHKRFNKLLRFLPLSILIKKAVIVLGNNTTPTLLIGSCKSANGIMDITKATSEFDIYKQLFFFDLQEFQVSMKPNILYQPESKEKFKTIKKLFTKKRKEPIINEQQWYGLSRYLETNDDLLENFTNNEEYAKLSLIVDTVSTKLSYYYDIPGSEVNTTFPDYGADVEFSMATIHYGPWAEKQRVPLQGLFFPAMGRDSEPTELTSRQYKGFKLNVFTNDEIIFRIPTREESKDKDALKHHTQPQNKRPFGWLELKCGPNSSVTLFNSFICSKDKGWDNNISCVFIQPEMRSSVNHDILYTADVHTMNAQVGFPLKWNGECEWIFNNFSTNGKIFFLREHTLLFSDIFGDFASGPPAPYEDFRSFKYYVNWELIDYKFYLNANDSNIINNPLDFATNKYISFQGPELNIKLLIPLLGQFTSKTTVDYYIHGPHFDLVLDVPPWHTCNAFLAPSYILGRAHNFIIDGSYSYLNKVEAYGFNNIVIKVKCDEVSLKFYGFLVKYVFVLRENYLGDNFHFKTFEEYNNEMDNNSGEATLQEDFDYWKVIKTDNSIDVLFTFQVRKGLMVLPQDIYGCKAHIGLKFDYFDTDIRFSNYYMDMQADFSPIRGKYLRLDSEDIILDHFNYNKLMDDAPHIEIDELTVHGHRMFGIPPEEITYFCNWRAATNMIHIDAPQLFVDVLSDCLGNFLNSFKDLENALHPTVPTVYDAIVFTFDCPNLNVKLNCEERCIITELNKLLLTFNDISNKRYSNKLSINIDEIVHKVIDKVSGNVLGLFKTSLTLDNPTRNPNYKEHRKFQQEHIRFNDAPFHRAPFLLFEENRNPAYNEGYGSFIVPMSLIDVNYPLNSYTQLNDSYTPSLSSTSLSSSDVTPIEDDVPSNTNLFMSPTLHYIEDDFQPDSQNDPMFKHDNMIFTFSEVNGYLSPEAIKTYALFQQHALETDLHVIMDNLEQTVVKELKKLMLQTCMNDTFRVVSPKINLAFGEYYGLNEDLKFLSDASLINISINEPSAAVSNEVKRTNIKEKDPLSNIMSSNNYITELSKSFAFSIKEINVCIQKSCDFTIKDIEFWMTEDTETILSSTVEDLTLNLDESKIIFLASFIENLLDQLQPSIDLFKKTAEIKKKLTMALIYKLSVASAEVNDDPSVLTKPAYIIRSLKEHIRFFDTWVVMIRLRHIFESMSVSWKRSEHELLASNNWEVPENVYDQVWETFSNWRSWEANYEDREQFFQKIFKIDILSEKKVISQVLLKNISINWSEDDYINFENVSISSKNRQFDANFSRTDHDLNDLDAKVGSVEWSLNLDSYNSCLSPVTLRLIPEIMDYFQNRIVKNSKLTSSSVDKKKSTNFAMFFVINLNDFNQKLKLNYLNLELSVVGLKSSGLFQLIEDENLFTFSSDINMLGVNIQDSASFGLENFRAVYGGGCDSYFFDLFIDNCFIEIENNDIVNTIESIIENDLHLLFLGTDKSKDKMSPNFEDPIEILKSILVLNANFNVQINHFSWVINVLKNYRFEGKVYDNSISFIIDDEVVDVGCLLQQVYFGINSQKSSVLEIKNSHLFNNIKILKNGDGIPIISIDAQYGFSKVFAPKMVKSVNEFLDNFREIREEIEAIISKLPNAKTNDQELNNSTIHFAQIPIDIRFSNDYMGVSCLVDRSKYSVEFEDFNFNVSNFEDENFKLVDYFGGVIIPTARFSVTDRIIPVNLSNFVDINVSVKLLNESKGKLLEVSSEYGRVCLSSGVVQRLVYLADELTIISKRLEGELFSITKQTPESASKSFKEYSFLDEISTIHFLAYNFCVGWIFDNHRKDYPGLIIGAERFYAVTDEGMGKLSLIEAYLSVAHGSTSNSFYGSQSEKSSPNRAFLPFMQTIYIINEDQVTNAKDMKITVTGDELDVKFLSDSLQIFESSMKSVSKMQSFFDRRIRPMAKWKDDSKSKEEQQVDYINSLRSTFESIECKITFAGSTVLIQRLNDNNLPASFFLHFPAVRTYISYIHDKIGPKKHIFRAEISTASSDNKLYPSCIPVITDLIDAIKGIMKNQAPGTSTPSIEEENTKLKEKDQKSFNFASVLSETDFYLGMKIDKQILSLSCEPTAKVESVVGIEGLNFQIMSGNPSSINILANLQSVSISLQHIYSREVSGYFKIDSILNVTNLDFHEYVEVKSSGSITDVHGYVNVKQYQDLDLFKDIWFPSSLFDAREPNNVEIVNVSESLAANKNIALRFKEVSTTNAIPWLLTYVLLNLSIKVNFGPSLGEMIFNLDKFWVLSKKSTDWTQELKLGIDSFILTSEGRLGGKILGNDIYLNSAISWKIDNETLDVPLILMSTGIENLQIKSTFDDHLFLVSNLEEFSLDVFNQKSEAMISKDHLFVTTKFKIFEIYMSSFTASNIYDIYNAILRMTQENKISYKETLHDSKTQNRTGSNKKQYNNAFSNVLLEKVQNNAILETVKKLETEFEVIMGMLLIHVYPSSFDDSKVLVIKLDKSTAFFSQNEYNEGISNQLEIQFNDLMVSLSINSTISENFITTCSVKEFIKYAHKARGGNIFVFPSFSISMKTFQKYNSNLIEYLYESTFGGTVDVRWNLGSVNFIREMYSIHLKSVESRSEFKKTLKGRDDVINNINFKQNIFTNTEQETPVNEINKKNEQSQTSRDPVSDEIDQVINERIDKVSKHSKYTYLPLAPPIIEAPQLKELGNATPPLEWFGLHRNKFPNVTHELGIVNLQKIIHEVESEYSKLLGRA